MYSTGGPVVSFLRGCRRGRAPERVGRGESNEEWLLQREVVRGKCGRRGLKPKLARGSATILRGSLYEEWRARSVAQRHSRRGSAGHAISAKSPGCAAQSRRESRWMFTRHVLRSSRRTATRPDGGRRTAWPPPAALWRPALTTKSLGVRLAGAFRRRAPASLWRDRAPA